MIKIDILIENLQKVKDKYGVTRLPIVDDRIQPPIGLKVEHLLPLSILELCEGGARMSFKHLDADTAAVVGANPGFGGTTYYVRDIDNNNQYELFVVWAADYAGLLIESVRKTSLL